MLYTVGLFQQHLRETFHGLANLGFRAIVAYTGHYPTVQTDALAAVASDASDADLAVIPFWEPLACGGGDHGGAWETSIFMALRGGEARLSAVTDRATGEAGHYRGQRVAETASVALGEWALRRIEEYLTLAVDAALA
jgi:creatinine amidohydrolase/Fe(II)-dependent formamide hydrolase-like protein